MRNKPLHIALNMDDAYLVHATNMLTSVFVNNAGLQIVVHIIAEKLSEEAKAQLKAVVCGQYGKELSFHIVTSQRVSEFPSCEGSHISQATYYRLFMADLLPESVHKVLYLDCDLVVETSLAPLLDIDMSHSLLAAVEDMWSGKKENYERLGYPAQEGYFNAGVLLVNLEGWRRRRLSELFVAFSRTHEHLVFYDQDILNGVLHGQWLELSPKWNVQDGFLRRRCKVRAEKLGRVRKEAEHPAVVHYTGHRKPWRYDSVSPYRNRYFHYLDMTAWKGWRPATPWRYKLKTMVDALLYTLRLKPLKYDSRYRAFR